MPFEIVPSQIAVREITKPDPDASQVPPVKCDGCVSISVGADSDTKGAQLTFRIAFRDSLGNPAGTTAPITLVASQTPDWGDVYLAADSTGTEPAMHAVGHLAYVQVIALKPDSAKWTLGAVAQ